MSNILLINSLVSTETSFVSLAKQYAPPSMADTFESDAATLVADAHASDITSNTAVTNWLYAAERVVGDKAVIEDTEGECFYVIYIVKPASADETVANASVRHILIAAETEDAEGNALDEATIAKNDADAKATEKKVFQLFSKKKEKA